MQRKLILLMVAVAAVSFGDPGESGSAVAASSVGITFVPGSSSTLILEKEGRQYRIDLAAQTVVDLGAPADPAAARAQGADPGDPNGQAIFKQQCIRCHGAGGKGIASIGTPNFTTAQVQESLTDEQIIHIINNGKPGTIMPAWKGILSSEQIKAVAEYVRSLGPAGTHK